MEDIQIENRHLQTLLLLNPNEDSNQPKQKKVY